jgi:signal transduction histidine kinase
MGIGDLPKMTGIRLRTKLLFSLIFISAVIAAATVLIVRLEVQQRTRQDIDEALRDSVVTFQNFQRQREATLARSAGLLADLPNLRALMTTQDAATIRDSSADLWHLAESDLFVLADRAGRVVALHTASDGFAQEAAQKALDHSLRLGETTDWWFGKGHLYEVFLKPIYFGSLSEGSALGVLGIGYEVNADVAKEVSQIASSEVAFSYGGSLVISTLLAGQQAQLLAQLGRLSSGVNPAPGTVQLGEERFLGASVKLPPSGDPAVSLTVLKSQDRAMVLLRSLNRWLLGIGLAALLAGVVLAFLVSHTVTRPLESLVSGVRALEKGQFDYPLLQASGDEVGQLTQAFRRMRETLQKTQNELLQAERLATMGQMASAISHDLRHRLTAILAYAEFLSDSKLSSHQREDFYQEIRQAVNRMEDLIGSLLEIAKPSQNLQPVHCSLEEIIQSAVHLVQARPEFRRIRITVSQEGPSDGWFDPGKLERVFHNLLLNACEAVSPESGMIEIRILPTPAEGIVVRIADNGPGIPQPISEKLFAPFVSYGKENGTGLGLAVARKMVRDHGGNICVEHSGPDGNVFMLAIPLGLPVPESAAKA